MLYFKKLNPNNNFDCLDLIKFYDTIYRPSFQDVNECDELVSIRSYLLESADSVYWDYCVMLAYDDETVVGGIIYDYLRSTNTAFIEFLVIRPDKQRKGIARKLFEEVKDDLKKSANKLGYDNVKYIFAEMDDPAHHVSDNMSYMKNNAKFGFRKLHVNYVQPPLVPDKEPVDTLWLIGYSPDGYAEFDKDVLLASVWGFFSYAFNLKHAEHSVYYQCLASSVRNDSLVSSSKF